MLRAALLALGSALLGGAIALAARKRPSVLERTRTFAFAAAGGVVVFHLLPEVLPELGLSALLWCAIGFALPWVLEAIARALGPRLLATRGFSGLRVAMEVGYVALLFHSLVEGLALVAALAQPGSRIDLEIALVAHHAPLTAAVVLPFLEFKGPRAVAIRALIVGLVGALGALLSNAFPGFTEGVMLARATAVTAGALLHVVADEIGAQEFYSGWGRAADLGAALAGLLVAGFSAALQIRQTNAGGPAAEFLRIFSSLALASAPALLVGAALASLSRGPRWDALLVSLALVGPRFALCVGALMAARFARRPTQPEPGSLLPAIRERAPRVLALLVAASAIGLIEQMPDSLIDRAGLTLAVLLAARFDEAGAVLVAAVLMARGFPPPLALLGLALGPFARKRTDMARAAISAGIATLVAVTHFLPDQPQPWSFPEPLATQAGLAAVLVLAVLAARALWLQGARGFFSPLRHRAEDSGAGGAG
jgi:hypothetical protein